MKKYIGFKTYFDLLKSDLTYNSLVMDTYPLLKIKELLKFSIYIGIDGTVSTIL